MKNKTKGKIILVASCLLSMSMNILVVHNFLKSILPIEMWWGLIFIGIGLGYIMSKSDS